MPQDTLSESYQSKVASVMTLAEERSSSLTMDPSPTQTVSSLGISIASMAK